MAEKPLEESPLFAPVVVPDGIYNAKVSQYRQNVHPKYGESIILDFEILDGSHKGKVIGGFASWKKITKKTKLYRWAVNLKAPVPTEIGQSFNSDGLIGKVGRILTMQVQRVDREGKPFWQSIVKDVLAAEGSMPSLPSSPAPMETQQNKFDRLKQFAGKEFVASDLVNIGFNQNEIDALKTMGYIYEPRSGILKLVG